MLGLVTLGAMSSISTAAPRATGPPRVVLITNGTEAGFRPFAESFLQGMRQLGHVEGKTFRLDIRYANREPARTVELIRDSAAEHPAVLVVNGLTAARRARDATRTTPVVVATSSDLVDAGVVASFAHPGGNVTGLTDLVDETAVKRFELLREFLPRATRIAMLNNPDSPATTKIEDRVRAAAQKLGVAVTPLRATDRASLAIALDSLTKSPPDALFLGGDALVVVNAQEIIERVTGMRVPVVHFWPGTPEMGALFSQHADIRHNYHRAAFYVDRILKGAKPGDLPVEQPARYELVVNRKVATALGITIPPSILLRADLVIE